jgi:hypothetical protein
MMLVSKADPAYGQGIAAELGIPEARPNGPR